MQRIIKLPGALPGASLSPSWLDGVRGRFRDEFPAPPSRANPELARNYLAKARQDLGELPPLAMLTDSSSTARKQAEYLQESYRSRLGLAVKIDQQVFKERLEKMRTGAFDLVISGWGPDFADPLTFVDLVSRTPNNHGRYENPALDEWLAIGQLSDSPQERMEAFDKIQRIVDEDAVILPLFETGSVYVRHPRLKGVVRRAVGFDPDLRHARIDD